MGRYLADTFIMMISIIYFLSFWVPCLDLGVVGETWAGQWWLQAAALWLEVVEVGRGLDEGSGRGGEEG